MPRASTTEGPWTLEGGGYGYHIGYLWFIAQWRSGADVTSGFEYRVIDLPRVSNE